MGLPVPVSSASGRDPAGLGREITLLSAQINVANYRLLKLIADFDVLGGWRCGGAMRSCAHWLAANCGMTIGAARERVRVARRLAGLPEVEQAFSVGELSFSKVRAITRVATPENESLLLAMAERTSASHLEQLVSRYQPVDELGLDGMGAEGAADECSAEEGAGEESAAVDEEARREHARELYWFQDEDGMWVIHGRLPPEQGQLVVKALEAVARPIQEERQDEWKEKQKARLRAAAREIARRHREAGVEVVGDGDSAGDVVADDAGTTDGAVPLAVEVERAEEKISAEIV
ncbi:MAG: DUF222 domain-containing protein [Halieaceae bacterium]|nr:DUF222 domain-containing protein [Halieaceae bacterium]